jgi:tRNA (cytidine/uridine-2'-O-)-methyltransferase
MSMAPSTMRSDGIRLSGPNKMYSSRSARGQAGLRIPLAEREEYVHVLVFFGRLIDSETVKSISMDKNHGVSPSLHVVLHQPEIPDNTGSVGRTCVALGAKLWLVRPLGFRVDDRHLRRAGLDYWQYLDWEVVDDWSALMERLPGCRPWFFTKHAATIYTRASFAAGDVLVFGSESQGLPRSLVEVQPDRCLRIPMAADARSLNLAVSVAVAAFEARRQWDR